MASETESYVHAVQKAMDIEGDGVQLALHINPFKKEVDDLFAKCQHVAPELATDISHLDDQLERLKHDHNVLLKEAGQLQMTPVQKKACAHLSQASKIGALYFMLVQHKLRLHAHVEPAYVQWKAAQDMCEEAFKSVSTNSDAEFTTSFFQLYQDNQADLARLSTIIQMVIDDPTTGNFLNRLFGENQTPASILAMLQAAENAAAQPVQLE